MGQNIASGWGSSANAKDWTGMINMWYNEVSSFNKSLVSNYKYVCHNAGKVKKKCHSFLNCFYNHQVRFSNWSLHSSGLGRYGQDRLRFRQLLQGRSRLHFLLRLQLWPGRELSGAARLQDRRGCVGLPKWDFS